MAGFPASCLVSAILLAANLPTGASAAKEISKAIRADGVFQYAVELPGDHAEVPTRAYLWIPPGVEKVRGLVVGGNVQLEPQFTSEPAIREACAEVGLGIVYFSPHLATQFEYQTTDAEERLTKALKMLAEASKRPEVADAPLIPIGHSAASLFAQRVFEWNPDRCIAVISYKGALAVNAERKDFASLRGVPALHVTDFGSSPEKPGSGSRDIALKIRAADPEVLLGLIEEDGGRHGVYSFRLPAIFAEFLRSAVRLRVAEDGSLHRVKASEGVLVDGRLEAPRFPPAASPEFPGQPGEALWFPSAEMARDVEKFHTTQTGKKTRDFAFVQNPETGELAKNDRSDLPPQWIGPDEFRLTIKSLAEGGESIVLRSSCGQLEQTGPDTFRLHYNPRAARWPVVMGAWEGDETHRYVERVKRIALPWKRGGGSGGWLLPETEANKITFNPPSSVKKSELPLQLEATSSSGLPVRFFVDYGPARLKGENSVVTSEWPSHESGPMVVSVVAFQAGSHIEPKVPPAQPVRRQIQIEQ